MHRKNQGQEVIEANQPRFVDEQKERNKRVRRRVIALGAVAVIGLGVVGGCQGRDRALDHGKIIENVTTAQGGETELISFDDTFESHEWTASVIQVTGASAKDETRVIGVSTGWKETKADFQVENTICIGDTPIEGSIDKDTGHVDINLPDKDSIKICTNIVEGSLDPHVDFSPSYAFSEGIVNAFKSAPWVEDTDLAKTLVAANEDQANFQLNTALVLGMKASVDNCSDNIWTEAKPAVEAGIANLYKRGIKLMQQKYPEINPDDISVLVAGQPISELTLKSPKSTIDKAYTDIQKIDKDNESFTMNEGVHGECKISKDIEVSDDLKIAASTSKSER